MREIHVTAAVLIRRSRLLAAQRPAGAARAGLWELPGGTVEPGESHEACLRRELAEELGVAARVGELFLSTVHDYPDLRVHLHAYRCECPPGEEPRPLVHAALRWLAAAELDAVAWSAADLPVLAALREKLTDW